MILGTVQLGMAYGIGNSTGKPSYENAFSLLDYAYHHGISMLDTAQAYGDSEQIIGQYHKQTGHQFQVCTKLPVEMSETTVQEALQKSADNLQVSAINVCYLHRFEQCYHEQLISDLLMAKKQGKVTKIGVSIYEPTELEYILEHFTGSIDVIQLPFNLLAKEYWDEKLLQTAHEKFTLYARSIYLQGLLLMPPEHPKVKELQGDAVLKQLYKLAEEWKTDVKSLAWKFVQYHPLIHDFLIGCETLEQLKENISFNQETGNDYYRRLQSISFDANEVMIDPRKW